MVDNRTAELLGDPARRGACRLLVASISAFSGGWGVFLDGEGLCITLNATLPRPGQPPGLWAREHRVELGVAKAQALLRRCVEVDLVATSLPDARPLRPDEPTVSLSLWGPTGTRWSLDKPLGVAHPGVDAIVAAAGRLKRPAQDATLSSEGPLGTWRPWLESAP